MIKLEGRLLNLDSVDIRGRKWAKDCKISFPDKVPVLDNFNYDRSALGSAEITKDDCSLSCKVVLSDESYTQLGGCDPWNAESYEFLVKE